MSIKNPTPPVLRSPTNPEAIVIRSPDFHSVYANNASLAVTTFDFSVIFGEIIEINKEGKLVIEQRSKVTMSPLHMKVLVQVLKSQVDAFESEYGEIKVPAPNVLKTPGKPDESR